MPKIPDDDSGGILMPILVTLLVLVGLGTAGLFAYIGIKATDHQPAESSGTSSQVQQGQQGQQTQTPSSGQTANSNWNIDFSDENSPQESNGIPLGSANIKFELHPVTSGIGGNYLFDITVGQTTKSIIGSVSSEELTEFINAIDFSGTNGNAVLMFEDGTGIQFMDSSKSYTADYGYIDVSENEFTMTERLGALWNDTGEGWYYKTVAEMRAEDEAEKAQNQTTTTQNQQQPERPNGNSQKEGNKQQDTSVNIKPDQKPENSSSTQNISGKERRSNWANGAYLGSSESDKYHDYECRAAKNILLENEVWFNSEEQAQAAGYSRCGICW